LAPPRPTNRAHPRKVSVPAVKIAKRIVRGKVDAKRIVRGKVDAKGIVRGKVDAKGIVRGRGNVPVPVPERSRCSSCRMAPGWETASFPMESYAANSST
jgi:hypothetical protein